MDPLVVFDCQKVMPDRFALTLAAAARSRAINRGAEPRIERSGTGPSDLALHEIAAGAFARDELAPFLPRTGQALELPPAVSGTALCGDGAHRSAVAPASLVRETVH